MSASSQAASSLRPATLIAATLGVGFAAFVGYAVYFDHRRRTDPDFRRSLKRESKREARIAKDQAQARQKQQKEEIARLFDDIQADGFPAGADEREAYFMEMVAEGEQLSQQGEILEAAGSFYKALKVYPAQADLISIYDKTVPKPVLDVLAEFIARDGTIHMSRSQPGSNSAGSVRSMGDSIHGVDD